MDIDILLALQEFRNGSGAFLASFFSKMTWLGELNTAIVIMALIYWCISKDFGAYFLMGWSGNRLVNGLYRSWARNPCGNIRCGQALSYRHRCGWKSAGGRCKDGK